MRWAGLAAVAILVGCGSQSPEPQPVGEKLVGSVAQMATCSDWNEGTRAQRIATIHDIRQQVNLKDSSVHTPELSDHAASEILDNTCKRDFAGSFRLYKLYARAASFAAFADN
jgi:hypothetical protein